MELQYYDLHYVAYGLMYNEIVDKEIWKMFVKNISHQKIVVPIISSGAAESI